MDSSPNKILAGRYELGELLGTGAFSEVYRARDLTQNREVALKLSASSLSPEEAARMRQEFRVLASLQHPRIIRTYDYGLAEDGRAYLSLELLEGKSLDQAVSGWGAELTRYALQALDALAFIHSEGYVHNDIKTTNLMIVPEKSGLMVMDFGFAEPQAKLIKEAKGTLGYLAPEALKGSEVDGRADLYSLGSVLYELACGRRPFEDPSPIEEIRKAMAGSPPLPSSLNRAIPPAVDEFLIKLLAKDPDERYASAQEAYKALAEATGMDVDPVTRPYAERPKPGRFVGRENEMGFLGQALDKVRETNQDAIVLLSGPEGIGKTRLLLEFKFSCQLEHLPVRWASEENDLPSLYQGLKQLRDYGVVGVALIDDWDEWDQERRELLTSFSLSPQNTGILWVFSLEEENQSGPAPFLAEESFTQSALNLKGLEREATQSLVASVLAPFDEIDRLGKWVFEQTQGNPLRIEEVIRFLYEEGILTPFGNEWRVDFPRLPEAWVGGGEREVLETRFAKLSPETRNFLYHAAVIGPRFPGGVLEALFGENFHEFLHELIKKGWVLPIPGAAGHFAFRVPGYQILIYESLSGEERKALHRKLGDWFESHGSGPEILSQHFLRAGDSERALRYSIAAAEKATSNPAGGAEKAAQYFEQALSLASSCGNIPLERGLCVQTGKQYDRIGEYARALKLYERASHLIGSGEKGNDEQAQILHRQGWTHLLKGDLREGQVLLEQALEKAGDSNEKGQILSDLGCAAYRQGNHPKALELFELAEPLLVRLGDSNSLTFVRMNKAQILQDTGHPEKAIEILKEALNTQPDPTQRPALLSNLGIAHWRVGDLKKAREVLLQGAEEAKEFGRLLDQVSILNNLALVEMALREWGQASEHLEQALILARRANDRFSLAMLTGNLSWAHLNSGELQRALVHGERALRMRRALGDEASASRVQQTLGLIQQRLGHWEEAREFYQEASRTQDRLGLNPDHVHTKTALGFLSLEEGPYEKALNSFDQGLSLTEGSGILSLILRSGKAQALARMGKVSEAEEIGSQALAEAKDLGDGVALAHCERAWGLLLRGKGLPDDSQKALFESADRFRSSGDVYETARSLLAGVEVGLDLGSKALLLDLTGPLSEACEVFERLGAEKDLARARGLEHRLITSLNQAKGVSSARKGLVEALSKVSELLNTLSSEEEVYARVLELLVTLFGAERGILFLKDPVENDLRVAKAYPASLDRDQPTITDAKDLSQTSALAAISQGDVLFSNAALQDERFASRQSVILNRIQSLMCAPLTLGGETMGAIYLDSRLGGSMFSDQDRPFLKAVASVAATAIDKAREYREIRERAETLRGETLAQGGLPGMIGTSQPMLALSVRAKQVAVTDATILIEGESGTGKELLAQAIHTLSKRNNHPFVAVDCGALPETLLESELFGHKKGSFTGAIEDKLGLFEEADGGTVFLDEISSASPSVQAKLLRFLQEGEIRRIGEPRPRKVNVRVLCATNKDLETEVSLKQFRRDLFYRLKVVTLKVPPLRERGGDIYLLAEHFRKRYAAKIGKAVRGFRREAMEAMLRSSWEGNVRELQSAVERAVILCQEPYLGLSELEIRVSEAAEQAVPFKERIDSQKLFLVQQALEETGGNVLRASRNLGLTRKELLGFMSRYGLKSTLKKGRPKKQK